ncbi:MAG TPA: hypothetical protein VGO24_01420 [Solirubrobacterales bacterium]|nr:hypothetical protein [Solirubrobacterales bacterium]
MAFVVATKRGRFEVRESRSTPDGPRSRTLASFTELTDEVIEKARARAAKPPPVEELREAAARAGAPVAGAPIDASARETLRRMANGEQLDPMLQRLLADALAPDQEREPLAASEASVSDSARAATQWIGVSLARRAEALRDLLELTDALPLRVPPAEIGFPRLRSA